MNKYLALYVSVEIEICTGWLLSDEFIDACTIVNAIYNYIIIYILMKDF